MDVLYLLIPLSAALVLGLIGLFAWALQSGQFDDLEQQGLSIFESPPALLDRHQAEPVAGIEQSPASERRA
ncbi:MAG TPA: cbb3-type cytochrome oxidase assembly protein CcoS [Burkholderiaceae bacterium]|nr:cbb3-type cytochrome oxidase assembly protein CcoS [Burkholderiaceae bacterium]